MTVAASAAGFEVLGGRPSAGVLLLMLFLLLLLLLLVLMLILLCVFLVMQGLALCVLSGVLRVFHPHGSN